MASLFEPGRIGPVEVPNRVIMAPMTTRAADEDGFVTPQTLAYYIARARGGVGLVTVEMASPERCGRHRRRELGIYDDRFLPGLRQLVAAIHAEGAKASIQLLLARKSRSATARRPRGPRKAQRYRMPRPTKRSLTEGSTAFNMARPSPTIVAPPSSAGFAHAIQRWRG